MAGVPSLIWQVIVRAFRQLSDAYKAGADKGTGARITSSGRSDARQYHYMQARAARRFRCEPCPHFCPRSMPPSLLCLLSFPALLFCPRPMPPSLPCLPSFPALLFCPPSLPSLPPSFPALLASLLPCPPSLPRSLPTLLEPLTRRAGATTRRVPHPQMPVAAALIWQASLP